MSKETAPKIGTIRFTAKEKEVIALGVDSEFFKLIERSFRPKRQIKIAVAALNMSQDDKDLFFFKGQSSELDWFVKELKKIADDYNKLHLDQDSDGPDEEVAVTTEVAKLG